MFEWSVDYGAVSIHVDLSSIDALIDALGNWQGAPEIEQMFEQWAVRYRSFVAQRFIQYSLRGGDWPDITHRDGAILRDTGLLFSSLQPIFVGAPGQLQETLPNGIRVGIGGNAPHVEPRITIGRLAHIHHHGERPVKQREIIVPPDAATTNGMEQDMENALDKLIRRTGNDGNTI